MASGVGEAADKGGGSIEICIQQDGLELKALFARGVHNGKSLGGKRGGSG